MLKNTFSNVWMFCSLKLIEIGRRFLLMMEV